MNAVKLTKPACPAHKDAMRGVARIWAGSMVVAGASLAAGCVTVNAPDEPIVIELNINITQEVIYRLAEDAGNTIEENADIF
jgi:hypothetical protein